MVRVFFFGGGGGLGLMPYVVKLFPSSKSSVVSWLAQYTGSSRSWVRIVLYFIQFFFLSNWRDLHFHEHFQLEIWSKCDIKAENSSTLCKFQEGRKGLRPIGSYADPPYKKPEWRGRRGYREQIINLTVLLGDTETKRLLRWCYTERFATTIVSATQHNDIVATLFWMIATLLRYCFEQM